MLSVFALQIYISKGKWINKTTHTVAFIVIAVLTTLFRHNALLFTIPLIIAAVIIIAKKRALMICLCIVTLIFGVKVPLYSAVGAESTGSRQVEVLGLPMTAIGAAVTMTPADVDDDILEFAYKVAPREVWEEKFEYGDYNHVKWDDRTNNSVIEEYGAAKVVSMALRCLKSSKKVTIKSLIKLTEPVYTLSDAYGKFLTPSVAENNNGISQNGVKALQDCLGGYKAFFEDVFPHLFLYLGAVHLIIIASILAKLKLNRFADWKRIFFVLPMLIYNYGTTLLLSGYHDADRFFYYSFLLLPVLLVFVFYNEAENNDIDNTERKAVETATSII